MCISTRNFDSIFSLWITLFFNFEIWRKWKILLNQLVSTTPLKLLNRIMWHFVVMKDIMCRYAFLQEMLIWGAIYIPFFVRLPVHNALNCHSLYTAFSSIVGAGGMWACSLFLSFHNGAVDIQIWAPLTRSQCKVSDTQVTVKACGSIVYNYASPKRWCTHENRNTYFP